jgi:hypothetical protein
MLTPMLGVSLFASLEIGYLGVFPVRPDQRRSDRSRAARRPNHAVKFGTPSRRSTVFADPTGIVSSASSPKTNPVSRAGSIGSRVGHGTVTNVASDTMTSGGPAGYTEAPSVDERVRPCVSVG